MLWTTYAPYPTATHGLDQRVLTLEPASSNRALERAPLAASGVRSTGQKFFLKENRIAPFKSSINRVDEHKKRLDIVGKNQPTTPPDERLQVSQSP
jgi:hypothetical protein